MSDAVLRCDELPAGALATLLGGHGLVLREIGPGAAIPHSYWGAPEAGIRGREVFVRGDTPVHSALHEACHLLCAAPRGAPIDTDAGGDFDEENAVLCLQVLLAEVLPGAGAERMLLDMDRWGYTFRLGSAAAWFAREADDARAWLARHGLLPDGCETVVARVGLTLGAAAEPTTEADPPGFAAAVETPEAPRAYYERGRPDGRRC